MNKKYIVDLLEFRKEILHFIRHTSRYPAESVNNDIKNDSNILIIDIIAVMTYNCVES